MTEEEILDEAVEAAHNTAYDYYVTDDNENVFSLTETDLRKIVRHCARIARYEALRGN